jgi:hypothetical protein
MQKIESRLFRKNGHAGLRWKLTAILNISEKAGQVLRQAQEDGFFIKVGTAVPCRPILEHRFLRAARARATSSPGHRQTELILRQAQDDGL